jgi:hypothetical protein
MAVVIEVDGAVAVGKRKVIALEAPLDGLWVASKLRLWAKTVTVASTMLSAQSPANLSCGASFPVSRFGRWKDLRTMVTCGVPHGHFSTRSGITEATSLTTWIIDWGLARCAPWVVLCEIATSRITIGVPSSEFWIIVGWLNETLFLCAMRLGVQACLANILVVALGATNAAANMIPEASIANTAEIATGARISAGGAVCIARLWVSHGAMSGSTSNQGGHNSELHG